MRRVVERLELELGLEARLLQMLLGERRRRIAPSAGLHRALRLALPGRAVAFIDAALDRALLAGGAACRAGERPRRNRTAARVGDFLARRGHG
jgi:hypothetical protein